MNKLNKILIGIIIFLVLIVGIFVGFGLNIAVTNHYDYQFWKFSCQDGCSLATKNAEGFLTNETWDCWEECDSYIDEILQDYALVEKVEP